MAVSPFAIFYGVEDRAYAPVALLTAVSTLSLLRALDTGHRRWWSAYVIATIAAIYSHYIAIFVVAVQAVWALWVHRDRLKTLIAVHGLILLAYVPWLPSFLVQQSHSADEGRRVSELAPASLKLLFSINLHELVGHPFVPLSQVPGTAAMVFAIATVASAAALAGWRVLRSQKLPGSPLLLAGALAIASPIGVGLMSAQPGQSFMIARNLGASFAIAMVVIAYVLVSARRVAPVLTAVVLAVMTLGAWLTVQPANRRSAYRTAARWIDVNSPSSAPVIQQFFLPITSGPLAQVTAIYLPETRRSVATEPKTVARAWQRARRDRQIFIVQDLPGVFKHISAMPKRIEHNGSFVLVQQRKYHGLSDVLVGEYRRVTR